MPTAEKYLKPEVIRQIKRLDLRCAVHRAGVSARTARQPVPWLFRRVQRAPQVHARRRSQGHRLADLRQDRQVLHQEVRGRDEHHRLPGDGSEPLDGLHLSAGADEVRVRHLPGGRAVLLDDPSARPGGADHLRRADPQQPAAADAARPPGRRAVAVGQLAARRATPTSRTAWCRWRPCSATPAW